MNKFVVLILLTTFVQALGIVLVMLKARLADVTEITIQNMLNIHWLWQQRLLLVAVAILAIPWLGSSFLIAQVSKEMSSGALTASVMALVPGVIGPIFFIGQFLLFQVYRQESLPAFGLNDAWIKIIMLALIQVGSIYLSYDIIQKLAG